MKKLKTFIILILIIFLSKNPIISWEMYDRVIAVVNNFSIIDSEINNKFNQIKKIKKVPRKKYSFEKSRILDKFIEDALVLETANDESIIISDSRVLTYIEQLMKQYFAQKIKNKKKLDKLIPKILKRLENRLKDNNLFADKKTDRQVDKFIKHLEAKQKISFTSFFKELRTQMRKEQVMSIAIGASPPSKKDALEWYKKNKKKLGYEVRAKQILIKPRNRSFSAEREANKKISELRKKILAGESFERLARKYSQDNASAAKGGDIGWTMLAELDPYFAGHVHRMRRIGRISKVFKSGIGYHIVKYLGRRAVSYEKVERLIMYKLYNESMSNRFNKWVARRKKESEIQIFMENYVKI